MIEHEHDKCKLALLVSFYWPTGKEPAGEAIDACVAGQPAALGELIANEPFWRYPIDTAGEGVAHLRVWLTAGHEPGHLAVVTEAGAAEVTESSGHIWADLA